MEPQYVVGVAAGRQGSAALLRDGRVVMGIDQARVEPETGGAAPGAAAIQYCLDGAGIDWSDVALLVESEVSEKSGRNPGHNLAIPDHVRRVGITRELAHAYAAAVPSTFNDAAIVVLCAPAGGDDDTSRDGGPRGGPGRLRPGDTEPARGERRCLYGLIDGRPTALHDPCLAGRAQWAADLVGFYRQVSAYVFGTADAIDDLPALAAYGRPGRLRLGDPLDVDALRNELARHPAAPAPASRGPGRPGATAFGEHLERYADVARWAQDAVEAAVLDVLADCHARYPSANLVFAGDLAGNTRLNRRIQRESPFEQFSAQPVGGDAGAAVGCCYYGWAEVLDRVNPPQHDFDSCFGRVYPPERVDRAVSSFSDQPGLVVQRPDDLGDRVVTLLADGRTVGWFEGGSELGPQPLGHRSVLADAGSARLRDRLIAEVTGQADFLPVAALVRAEDCAEVFETDDLSCHRTLSGRVRPAWAAALSGVTQVDGTADVQCVTDSHQRRLHEVLTAWARTTGRRVLANAALGTGNRLVETPEQALALLCSSGLDALVIGDYLIGKRSSSD